MPHENGGPEFAILVGSYTLLFFELSGKMADVVYPGGVAISLIDIARVLLGRKLMFGCVRSAQQRFKQGIHGGTPHKSYGSATMLFCKHKGDSKTMDLTGIIRISNRYGADPELVLAGGGNTSAKDDDTIYIKCSGVGLATIDENGFVPVWRALLDKALTKDYPGDDAGREAAFLADVMAARTTPGETRRPSVETLLHNLFAQRYVVHLHPALINGLTCGKSGERKLKELFGERALWIPVTRPGLTLSRVCHRVMGEHFARSGQGARLVFLENHGVFVAADTEQEIAEILEQTVATLREAVNVHPDRSYAETFAQSVMKEVGQRAGAEHLSFRSSPQILEFLRNREAASDLMLPFTPDQIVYCGAEPTYVETADEIEPGALRGKIILLEGIGIFALGQTGKEAETAAQLFLDAVKIAVYARSFGGAQPMPADLMQFIIHWEAEAYRQKEARK